MRVAGRVLFSGHAAGPHREISEKIHKTTARPLVKMET